MDYTSAAAAALPDEYDRLVWHANHIRLPDERTQALADALRDARASRASGDYHAALTALASGYDQLADNGGRATVVVTTTDITATIIDATAMPGPGYQPKQTTFPAGSVVIARPGDSGGLVAFRGDLAIRLASGQYVPLAA
ncbi:hypothetical protein AB0395_22090 [Streptosporangium sp. NPDC051023]|uniref:hypothetical protein n=1 Tax=Streptosporangium sp. NPDC051023 TaxID=3155410 RepID=UPI003450F9F3